MNTRTINQEGHVMSTPTIETPAPVIPAEPHPWARRIVRSKGFLVMTAGSFFFIVGVMAGGSTQPAPQTVTVAGPATVTTVAPAECGTALDGAAKFMTAVGVEHGAMGAAFTKAGSSGDVVTMTSEITAAVNTLDAQMKAISPPMIAAAGVCRAAMK